MVKEKTRRTLVLLSATCMSIITGCANLDMENINAKFSNVTERITSATSGTTNQSTQQTATADEGIAAAQAEADKICSSHVLFSGDFVFGKVTRNNPELKITSERGFYSIKQDFTINGHVWKLTYALANKDAKYAVLVAAKTSWERKQISAADLIEKFKKRDTNVVIKHFYDSGDVVNDEAAKHVTNSLISGGGGTTEHYMYNIERKPNDGLNTFGNRDERLDNSPRAIGLENLQVKAERESQKVERKIGCVLAGQDYQVIINESSSTTEAGVVDTQCPITGIYVVRIGGDSIDGAVVLEMENTAQIAAYRKLYKEIVEKMKEEEKAKITAEQEKALHF